MVIGSICLQRWKHHSRTPGNRRYRHPSQAHTRPESLRTAVRRDLASCRGSFRPYISIVSPDDSDLLCLPASDADTFSRTYPARRDVNVGTKPESTSHRDYRALT